MSRGRLITFEGVEGSGKSTLLRRVSAGLVACGREVITVREPGGTELGETIRATVLDAKRHGEVDAWSELFLMLAARAQLVSQAVRPALQRGQDVLCDRYQDASVAYQGGGRGIAREEIERLNQLAVGEAVPQLTFVVDLDPAEGRRRQRHEPDRMEREAMDFHRRVRQAYLDLATADPTRFRVLDGSQSPPDLVRTAWSELSGRFDDLPAEIPPLPAQNA